MEKTEKMGKKRGNRQIREQMERTGITREQIEGNAELGTKCRIHTEQATEMEGLGTVGNKMKDSG
jgi:hypothetical protein